MLRESRPLRAVRGQILNRSRSSVAAASGRPPQKRNLVSRILAAHWLPLVLVVLAVFIAQNRARISINLFWFR